MSSRPIDDPWTWHMRRGDYASAWAVSDAVLRARARTPCWHLPRHEQYVWNGDAIARRRVLVRCYHGLGDTIQFVRYAPMLRAIASEVSVWAQPALLPLLRTVRGIDRVLPLHDGAPGVDYDVDVEIMELPHVFRTTLTTVPNDVPYLHVAPASRPAIAGRIAVGVVWAAGEWDARRSVPAHLLASLANVPNVSLVVLQRGTARDAWPRDVGVDAGSDDVGELARTMRALDLVITVDSMPAHLAGALGVPVWTLLHSDADWRWMNTGERTPWYPTMRLFRQAHPGAWAPVVSRVATALAALQMRLAE